MIFRIPKIGLPILLVTGLLLAAVPALAGIVQLPAGHPVKLKFDSNMKVNSGDVSEGVPLLITLAEPIKIGGTTVVEEGATGTAMVTKVEKAGRAGKPGMIAVEFQELQPKGEFKSPEEKMIKLKGAFENKGKGKKTLSYILGFGLLIKGGQGEVPTDSVFTAEVAEDIILESE